jgi:nucleoside-diphosphate-sugar epimerase
LKILIVGANGFIGHHLCKRIIESTDWEIYAMDLQNSHLQQWSNNSRFHYYEGDMIFNSDWINTTLRNCDVAIPLAGIATPLSYINDPLGVFELNFEAQLPIIRQCATYHKRLIFPSTSEVYGMCEDASFDPSNSNLIYGPINKSRWIYATSKQLIDRIIYAYGENEQLDYTIFRPFNWIGTDQDIKELTTNNSCRVVTQFLNNILTGTPITLVNGGQQRRSFTAVTDGIDALMKIIANDDNKASKKIYNIGNPANNYSIKELAQLMIDIAKQHPHLYQNANKVSLQEETGECYYGKGYQDMPYRVPMIDNTCLELNWLPQLSLLESIESIFNALDNA